MTRSYWLDLFTYQTWNEFLEADAKVTGFRESRWKTVQKIKPGDILLCYLTGVSRWIGILEATGQVYRDKTPIWQDNDFSSRVPVRILDRLDVKYAVPVIEMRDQLSAFRDMKSPHAWTGRFRGSPTPWSVPDGEAVVRAIREAVSNPVDRAYDETKLRKIPPILKTEWGQSVTIPEDSEAQPNDATAAKPVSAVASEASDSAEVTAHTEIQWLLLKLGSDMGLDVWVAKNDRNKIYKGNSFVDLPKLKSGLPLQFDEATTRTIELIDVLWLKGNAIQSAFEIESTTSIFSGLLRMSDLITMQPNLNIPLYIVAPAERRLKVFTEINRPTFARREPPMVELCRFIAFDALREKYKTMVDFVRFVRPEFLDMISENCAIEEI